jgi:hypothetical protein
VPDVNNKHILVEKNGNTLHGLFGYLKVELGKSEKVIKC